MVSYQSKTTLHPHSYSSIPLSMVSYQSKTTLHSHSYSSIPLGMVSYQSKTTLHSHSYSSIPLVMVYLTYCYVLFAIKENDVELVSDKIFALVSMKNTLINSFGIDTYNYYSRFKYCSLFKYNCKHVLDIRRYLIALQIL